MPRNLTGYWTADDGGAYYLFQVDSSVWWLGQDDDGSLQKGTSFTNIFRGVVSATGAPIAIAGEWAEVPRGQTMNFGELGLSIEYDGGGNPTVLRKVTESGGFAGTIWSFHASGVVQSLTGIDDLFGKIIKNTWRVDLNDPFSWLDPYRETLTDNLTPVKDAVVVFGTLQPGQNVSDDPFVCSFPPANDLPPSWDAFVNLNDPYDTAVFDTDASDGDLTCLIAIEDADLPVDLFHGMSANHTETVKAKLANPTLHPEVAMFARPEDGSAALLPGWSEAGADSVLLNGVPLQANFDRSPDQSVDWLGIGGDAKTPRPGNRVRVTGVMSVDNGHSNSLLEIHPVYGLDVIDATARDDWSGVWGDSNRCTYYVHQVLNSFWMLITTPLRDFSIVVVFQGDLQEDGVTVAGQWCGLPLGLSLGSGPLEFILEPDKLTMVTGRDSPLAGRVLKKLYDADGHPCPNIGTATIGLPEAAVCQILETEGATVVYSVTNSALANLPDAVFNWTTSGGQISGSDSQSTVQVIMPAAGTRFTVSVNIVLSGACRYYGERSVTSRTLEEAELEKIWCEIQVVAGHMGEAFAVAASGSPFSGKTYLKPPNAAALERLQKAVDRLSSGLRELRRLIRD
ncbi:MAG: hypothetical protein WA814_05435 [Candidatus Baltobacteraceae bacterium]